MEQESRGKEELKDVEGVKKNNLKAAALEHILAQYPQCPRAIGIHQASFILHEDAVPIHQHAPTAELLQ